ncbi:MAG: hypothetical protein COA87_007890 [Halomonas sp.]|nr:hypothetical protein [Halomonas sp.]MBL1267656.1 hypothetical protein [Halomonas sp.]
MFRWLVTINAVDADGTPRTLRFSDGRYTRNGYPYFPRVAQPGLYRFGMQAGPLISAQASGFGETELINNDGNLNYLADYAIDGRELLIERVNNDLSITEILRGTATGFEFADNSVIVRLRDPWQPFEKPHPHQTYAGDNVLPNGVEGVEDDIKGTQKPQVYGEVLNAQPPMVNTSRLVYQVSSRSDCTVTAVYDGGAALSYGGQASSLSNLLSSTPSAGTYRRYQGYFRLGASPVGEITCDAKTAQTGAGSVMAMLCADVSLPITSASVSALNDVGTVGLYVDSNRSTVEMIDELITSVGAYRGIDVSGTVFAGLLVPPEDQTAEFRIEPYMVSESDRSEIGVGDNGLPLWRVEMDCDHIESTLESVAGSVSSARAARLKKAARTASAESQATKSRHLLSLNYREVSRLRSVQDATAVCQRLIGLYSVRRDRVSIEVQVGKTQDWRVGQVGEVYYPRLGYDTPRKMLLIGIELDAESSVQRLQLWG